MEKVIWKDPNINISIAGFHATGSLTLVDSDGQFFAYYDISVAGHEYKGRYQLKGNEEVSGSYAGFKYRASISDWTLTNTTLSFHVKAEVKILAWWKTLYEQRIVAQLPDADAMKLVSAHLQNQMERNLKEEQVPN